MGREFTLQLLQKQANVVGIDINPSALAETQKIAGVGNDRFKGFAMDIIDKTKVDALPEVVIQHFGSVDGLINKSTICDEFYWQNDEKDFGEYVKRGEY